MAAKEAGPFRMIFTLGVAGLLSGVVLVGVFLATKPRIERNRAEALERAIYKVVPGASARKAFVLKDGALVELPKGEKEPVGATVYGAYDDKGDRLGYAVPAAGAGFQDTIKLIYGIDPGRKLVIGMFVLESLETPGLGDKIIKDEAFVGQFKAMSVVCEECKEGQEYHLVPVKAGTKTKNYQVDAISGATISSKAVTKIINKGNDQWLKHLPTEGGKKTQEAP